MSAMDRDYVRGYWDAKLGRIPNSNRVFWTEDYILGYAHYSMERDMAWRSIRAHSLNLYPTV